jgi:hypothetical protein
MVDAMTEFERISGHNRTGVKTRFTVICPGLNSVQEQIE